MNNRKILLTVALMALMVILLFIANEEPQKEVKAAAPRAHAVINDDDGWVTVRKVTFENKTYHVFRWWCGGRGTMQVVPINSPAQKEVKDK